MKNNLYILTAALAFMALGCTETEPEAAIDINTDTFKLEAKLSYTKTVFTPPYAVKWSDTDELSVIVNSESAYKFTKTAGEGAFESADFSPEQSQEYTYCVFYPYDDALSSISSAGETVVAVAVPVKSGEAQVQSASGNTAHIQGNLCGYAKATGTASPQVNMKHLTALFKVSVYNPSSSPLNIKSLTLSTDAADAALCGTFYVNPQTADLRSSGSAASSATLTLTDGSIPSHGTGEFWLSTAAFSVPYGNEIVLTMTSDTGEVVIEKPAPADGWNFEAGSVNSTEVVFSNLSADCTVGAGSTAVTNADGSVSLTIDSEASVTRSYLTSNERTKYGTHTFNFTGSTVQSGLLDVQWWVAGGNIQLQMGWGNRIYFQDSTNGISGVSLYFDPVTYATLSSMKQMVVKLFPSTNPELSAEENNDMTMQVYIDGSLHTEKLLGANVWKDETRNGSAITFGLNSRSADCPPTPASTLNIVSYEYSTEY